MHKDITHILDNKECPDCGSQNYTERISYREGQPVYLSKRCGDCLFMEGIPVREDSEI